MNVIWSDDMDAVIVVRAAEGASSATIGKELGVTKNAVIGRARRIRAGFKNKRADMWSEADQQKAIAMRLAGIGPAAIAEAIGRTVNAVERMLYRAGLRFPKLQAKPPPPMRLNWPKRNPEVILRGPVAKAVYAWPEIPWARGVGFYDLTRTTCRFPLWDKPPARVSEMMFCGAPAPVGPYCPDCAQLTVRKP